MSNNFLTEAQLSDKTKADIDYIIKQLQDYRDADFEGIPGGAPYSVGVHTPAGYTTVSNDLVSFMVQKMKDASNSMTKYGKTKEQLEKREQQRQADDAIRGQALQGANELKTYFDKIEARFPRYFKFLNLVPNDTRSFYANFAIVEPSGVRKDLRVRVGEKSAFEEGVRSALSKCIRLFRHPDYNQLESKVQQLRDFGFNVTGKLLNTDGGTFRTRYAVITNVTLAYSGVGIRSDNDGLHIVKAEEEGSAIVKTVFSKTGLTLDGVQIGHIGEIIDTIDIMLHVLHTIPLRLQSIDLIGREVVEYRLEVDPSHGRRPGFTVQSVDIKSVPQLTKLLYEKKQQSRTVS